MKHELKFQFGNLGSNMMKIVPGNLDDSGHYFDYKDFLHVLSAWGDRKKMPVT